jgi:hypothetical protein
LKKRKDNVNLTISCKTSRLFRLLDVYQTKYQLEKIAMKKTIFVNVITIVTEVILSTAEKIFNVKIGGGGQDRKV